jgi:DNA-binding response OmpR family regulator
LRALLLGVGCTGIHEAADGSTGLEAVRAVHPDIVLLDWDMPDMDGAHFVRTLRSAPLLYPRVPIVMMTGRGDYAHVLEAVRLGVHEFLLKPVSGGALKKQVLSVLARSRAVEERDRQLAIRKLAS